MVEQTEHTVRIARVVEAPVIFFDTVPTTQLRGGVVGITLAVQIGDPRTKAQEHVVSVANLRFPLAVAAQLRDLLEKVLLAATPTASTAN